MTNPTPLPDQDRNVGNSAPTHYALNSAYIAAAAFNEFAATVRNRDRLAATSRLPDTGSHRSGRIDFHTHGDGSVHLT
ncbi:MAG: hypothetical protein MUF87_21350 [Anaerolineae bacterium]|jgi:hypothetical protein|nr:hypothetical protein [Anaerolineae bacterium]